MKRIPTLDGWRGVAILLVIAAHASPRRYNGHIWANLGDLGVDIFFVISGYVITGKLLEERENTASINLTSFYIRRAFRILPLVVAYLMVLSALSLFLDMELRPSHLAGSLFFFRNYQRAADSSGIFSAHFWSLSIEEHFYLLWPLLFLKLGKKKAAWFGVIFACLCSAWRSFDFAHPHSFIGQYLPGDSSAFRQLRTDVRFDGLLIGCVLAILLTNDLVRAFIFRNCPKEAPLVFAMFLLMNEQRTDGFPTLSSYLLIAGMIASTLIVKEGLAFKWLNSRPLVFIGLISYSLYIWQQLFLERPPNGNPLGIMGELPFNLMCALGIASCSYFFFEKPLNKIGHRFASSRDRDSLPILQTAKGPQPEG